MHYLLFMPTYHANGLAWTYSERCGECLDDFELSRDECEPGALAAFDALPQDERDSLEGYAQEEAWEAARDDDEDNYICGRLTARGIL